MYLLYFIVFFPFLDNIFLYALRFEQLALCFFLNIIICFAPIIIIIIIIILFIFSKSYACAF